MQEGAPRFRLTGDAFAGIVGLLGSIWLFLAAANLPRSALVPIGPEFYPRILFLLTGVLSAILAAQGLLRGARAPAGDARPSAKHDYAIVAIVFAIFFLYVFALPWLGFRVSTFLFMILTQAAIDRPSTGRRWLTLLAVALGATFVAYLVFETYLDVLLPRGRWTGF